MLPVFQMMSGSKFLSYMKQLRKSQWWTLSELNKLRNKRLRCLINHAYDTVPYYRRLFRQRGLTPQDIRTVEDLVKLPVMTKDIIRRNFDELVSRKIPKGKVKLRATGGSTGEPLNFYVSQETMDYSEATRLRGWEIAGYQFGEKSAKLWASTFDAKKLFSLKSRFRRYLHRHLLLDSNVLTPTTMKIYTEQLRQYKPTLLMGYTSSLFKLAEFILNSDDIEPLSIPAIVTGAETLYPHWRPLLRNAFGGEVFNHYLTRETCVSSDECPSHEGSHVSIEVGHLEILSENESVIDEHGRVLVTDFFNFAMPFIRFDLQDVALLKSERCSCGRSLPLLDKILGRINDLIVSPTGVTYNPVFFMWLVYRNPWKADKLEGIQDYQIVQQKIDYLIVNIVPTEDMPIEIPDLIRENILRETKNEFEVEIRLVDELPLTQAGKRRYVISEISTTPTFNFEN